MKSKKPITILFIVVGFYFIINKINGQETNLDSIAQAWLDNAKSATKENSLSQSDSLLRLARNYYQQQNNWGQWYISVSRSNSNAIKRKEFKVFIDSLLDFKQIVPPDSAYIMGKINFKIALNYQYIGNIYRSIRHFKKSIRILESVKSQYGTIPIFKSYYKTALLNTANGYSKLNDQGSAIKYIKSYLNYATSKRDTCNYIGLLGRYQYFNNDYEKAKLFLIESIEKCNSIASKNLLAQIYIEEDSLDLASIRINQIKKDNGEDVDYLLTKSIFNQKTKNLKQAIEFQERAIELIQTSSKYSPRTLQRERIVLAGLYSERGDDEQAARISHQTLTEIFGLDPSLDMNQRPIKKGDLPDIWTMLAFYYKAKYFIERHKILNTSKDLRESEYYYDLLFSSMNELKSKHYSNSSQYQIGSNNLKIYDDLVQYYISLYEKNKDRQYLNRAFTLSQNSNAFVLKYAISERKAISMTGISQDSIDEYFKLVNEASKVSEEDNSTLNKLDEYRNQLVAQYPYFDNLSGSKEMTIDQIQDIIDENSLLLKYDLVDNEMGLFAIAKDTVKWYDIILPQDFESEVDKHLELVSDPNNWNENDYKVNGILLFDLLLKEVLGDVESFGISHLYIVPNEMLSKISFSALLQGPIENKINPENYLVWDYSISYLYYCGQLLNHDLFKNTEDEFIGFGLQYEDEFLQTIKESVFTPKDERQRSATLVPLKYAIDEVNQCASYFDGTIMINESVTPNSVKRQISNYQIVHISAHALVDHINYMDSYLALYQDQDLNYKYTYEDIIKSNLRSNLVVLSACQTGIGSDVKGEGLMSLCRAFIQSGSNAVMGSYWNASDNPTKEIMNLFYKNLKPNIRKSKALQLAQKEYLSNDNISSPRIRTPYYWASWTLYGQDNPYEDVKNGFSNKLILLSVVALILVFFVALYRHKKP